MAKLGPVSWRELVRKLQTIGFTGPLYRDKHPYMVRVRNLLTIPNPHRQDIGVDLLSRILRQAEVTREQWEALE